MLPGSKSPADEFWLSAHNQPSREPVLDPWLLGLGLGVALLAEMLIGDRPLLQMKAGPPGSVHPDIAVHEQWAGWKYDDSASIMWGYWMAREQSAGSAWFPVESAHLEIIQVIWQELEGGRTTSLESLLRYLAGDQPCPRAQIVLEGRLTSLSGYETRDIGYGRTVSRGRLAIGTAESPALGVPYELRKGFRSLGIGSPTAYILIPRSSNLTGWPSGAINNAIRNGERLGTGQLLLIALYNLTDLIRRTETIGTEYWPSPEQYKFALTTELNELLICADEIKGTKVLR